MCPGKQSAADADTILSRMTGFWLQTLRAGDTLLLDGGTGTELRRRGMSLDAAAWSGLASLTHYDLLRAVHTDYIDAGADVITTNTFGTSRFVLEAAGYGEQFAAINRRAVDAAREARDSSGRDVAIAASLSCLPPNFDARAYPDGERERAAYRELTELFAEGGVDLIALEMMQDVRHASLACEAAAAIGLPFWLGVSCRRRADSTLVAFDFPETEIASVLDALLPFGPAAVNVMHSPPDAIEPALALIAARWRGARGAYPESGGGAADAPSHVAPAGLAAQARGWIASGARIVGGCCGTTPEHVRALREAAAQPHAGTP
jgi:S-methylmethionine-dependent homocysteine/selenocysteine methylase